MRQRFTLVMISLAMVLLVPASLRSDELTLKDGRKIEWKTITDAGDTYEIETAQGTKLSVKKADVEKFTPTAPLPPLTGASFTFDPKKVKLVTIDLLQKIDPKRDTVTGSWRGGGGGITGTGGVNALAKLQTTYTPPEEYDLTLEITRKEGAENIAIGIIGGGRQFAFELDCLTSTWSGPHVLDGKEYPGSSGVGVPGKLFTNGKPRVFTFMIRKEVLIVRLDGKDWFPWKAEWNRLNLHPSCAVTSKNTLFFVVGAGTYQIGKAAVVAPKE